MLVSQAYAQTGGAPGGGDLFTSIVPLILIFVVFYFLLIRPQQKKAKEQREKIAGVKRGDRVVLGGGMIGLVTKEIGDHEIQVEVAEGVRVRVVKQTVTDILARGEPVRNARDAAKDAASKDGTEDEKPYIVSQAPAPAKDADGNVQRPQGIQGILGSLFGRKKT